MTQLTPARAVAMQKRGMTATAIGVTLWAIVRGRGR